MTPQIGDRTLFPRLEAVAYLNHAAVSPASSPVEAAVQDLLLTYARKGLGAISRTMEIKDAARGAFASLIGAESDDVGLVENTTTGVRTVAFGMPWKAGDRILLFDGEFPTNVTPWKLAADTFDLELVYVPLDGFDGEGRGLDLVEEALRMGVRLVAVSAVQFDTGLRMPLTELGELCRRYDAELFVDAIQACGVCPIDVGSLPIDYLACGGHKWLMGLEGAGFLWVNPERIGEMVPRMAGWLSHEEPIDFLIGDEAVLAYDKPIRAKADFTEGAASNALGYAAASASIPMLDELGADAIYAHVQAYHDRLEPILVERGFRSLRATTAGARSGILSVLPPEGQVLSELAEHLRSYEIAVSTPNGKLRFAPHWPNDLDEVDAIIAAIS